MFKNDMALRSEDEKIEYTPKMIKEYIKCKEDIFYFAEKYYYITTLDDGRVHPSLWNFQKKILKTFINPNADLELNIDKISKKNVIVNAPRQIGKTTMAKIFLTHFVLFNSNKTVAILANKERIATKVLAELKDSYKDLPLWLQQGIRDDGWNKTTVKLGNGSQIISSATSSSAIRSYSINILYLDEFAHVPQNVADDFMRSVYPTIVTSKDAKIIIVSTPKGLNHFYHLYRNAILNRNTFRAVRIRWDEVPGRNEKFKDSYILDNGILDWNQEMAGKFLGSSNTLVDSEILERIYTIDPIDTKYGSKLKIFEQPIKEHNYVLGCDSAKGNKGGDFSVIQVLDVTDEYDVKQVAVYRNQLPIHDFAQVIIELSKFYNEGMLMIENNIYNVAEIIWYEFEYTNIANLDKKGIGFRTTKNTKLAMLILLKRYIENGWIILNDIDTLQELSNFEEMAPNIFRGGNGSHDDLVMGLGGALLYIESPYYNSRSNETISKINDKFKLIKEEKEIEENDIPPVIFNDENDESIF